MCVLRACVPCSAVHALRRAWEEMRDERRPPFTPLSLSLSLCIVPACSVTSALWHVAVLKRRAIIWCQVVRGPQTSVTPLPWLHCTVSGRLGSCWPPLYPEFPASFIHSFGRSCSSCQTPLDVTNLHALYSLYYMHCWSSEPFFSGMG